MGSVGFREGREGPEWEVWTATGPRLPFKKDVRWADDRWGHPLMRIDVGGWEVGGRLPRGPYADVRRVRSLSAATQTRRMFALEMGQPGHKTDQMGQAVARWAVWFVSFTPNGWGQTGWGRAMELA